MLQRSFRLLWTWSQFSASRKPELYCPSCKEPIKLQDFGDDLHFRCRKCQAELKVGFRHDWLYVPICFLGGLIAAFVQRLQNPLFIICALIYTGIVVIVAAPVLAPLFPPRIRLAGNEYIQRFSIREGHDSAAKDTRDPF
jgi:hypothetical protein